MRRISAIYLISFLILAASGFALAEETGTEGATTGEEAWDAIRGSYATIYVQSGIDLKRAAQKIDVDFARYDPVEKKIFLEKEMSEREALANKIDILIRKARKILDMYPQNFRVDIKIYNNDEELRNAYKDIFEEAASHKAFYIHKFKTIYISVDNLSASVLAHEIGHAIIDNYFSVTPPTKIAELLACYVDLHLRD